MEDWIWAILGCGFFPALFSLVMHCQTIVTANRLNIAVMYAISVRVVSAVQATIASCVGFVIVNSCRDVLHDRHWLTEPYAWFMAPYFYYDLVVMYRSYWHKKRRSEDMSTIAAFVQFVRDTPLLTFHHTCFPLVYLPVVVWWRRGVGDYFVGCFYMIELAVPFISIRAILIQLHKEDTIVYLMNGAALFVTFTLCRVAIFPYLYWVYGRYIDIPAYRVPFHIPVKCTVGCASLLVVQLYWWLMIGRTSIRTLRNLYQKWHSVGKVKLS